MLLIITVSLRYEAAILCALFAHYIYFLADCCPVALCPILSVTSHIFNALKDQHATVIQTLVNNIHFHWFVCPVLYTFSKTIFKCSFVLFFFPPSFSPKLWRSHPASVLLIAGGWKCRGIGIQKQVVEFGQSGILTWHSPVRSKFSCWCIKSHRASSAVGGRQKIAFILSKGLVSY